jgi:hypothetical protein
MKKIRLGSLAVLLPLCSFGQNSANVAANIAIDEVAMLRIVDQSGNPITALSFPIVAPTVAGDVPKLKGFHETFLQFTSIASLAPDNYRSISIEVIPTLPPGLNLNFITTPPSTINSGNYYSTSVSNSQPIGLLADNIESGFTGDGANAGVRVLTMMDFNPTLVRTQQSGTYMMRYTLSNY